MLSVSFSYYRARIIELRVFIPAFIISCIGLLFVFSATYSSRQTCSLFFKKQAFGIGTGIIIFFILTHINRHALLKWAYITYFILLGLLAFTLIKGHVGMGGQRWLDFFFFRMQPSELAKPLFPAFVVYYISTYKDTLQFCLYHFLPIVFVLALSFLLIRPQPDLGTALIIGFTGLIILWLADLPTRWFLYGFLACALLSPLGWWTLREYQRQRIMVFIGGGQKQRDRYQIEQSLIAIGSGGYFGKGLFKGTQNKLRFLPESRTDFIFAVLCEEWGFFGALTMIVLFCLFIGYLMYTIFSLHSSMDQLLALGLVLHIILSIIINICMVLGLLPIVGIPLPLMSYGISNMWVTWGSLGWFCNISMHQMRIT